MNGGESDMNHEMNDYGFLIVDGDDVPVCSQPANRDIRL